MTIDEKLEDYNPTKKVVIVFYNMIAHIKANKRLSPAVNKLFMRGRKLNISLGFSTQSYFRVPKDTMLNVTHYFIMKIPKAINSNK